MYQIVAPALIEVQWLGRLDGQRVRNVWHFVFKEGTDETNGRTAAEALIADIMARWGADLLDVLSSDYTLEFVTAQWILPDRFRMFIQDVNTPGSEAGGALPGGCSIVVSKYADFAGRAYQGRTYLAGIPNTAEEDGLIKEEYLDPLQVIVDKWKEPHSTPTNTGKYFMTVEGLEEYTGSQDFFVTNIVAREVLRYQRRREVGVGE